jgi:hypothetical protein
MPNILLAALAVATLAALVVATYARRSTGRHRAKAARFAAARAVGHPSLRPLVVESPDFAAHADQAIAMAAVAGHTHLCVCCGHQQCVRTDREVAAEARRLLERMATPRARWFAAAMDHVDHVGGAR